MSLCSGVALTALQGLLHQNATEVVVMQQHVSGFRTARLVERLAPGQGWKGRLWLAVAALMIAGCAVSPVNTGQHVSLVRTVPLDTRYLRLFDAVEAAACSAVKDSKQFDREHVGALLRFVDGRYGFTHGINAIGVDRVRFAVPLRSDAKVVALWHTHGEAGPDRHLFSVPDIRQVRGSSLPFVLVTPRGEVRVLTPEDAGSLRPQGGQLIGQIASFAQTCQGEVDERAIAMAFPSTVVDSRPVGLE